MHCVKKNRIRSYSSPHFSHIFPYQDIFFTELNNTFCSHITVSPNLRKWGQNADQNNSECGLFLRSDVPDCERDSPEEGKQGK